MTRAFKYILPFTLYGLGVLAFTKTGVFTWLPLVYTFICIPVLEIMVKPASNNLSAIEEDIQKVNPVYDYILYAVVVFQFVAGIRFCSGEFFRGIPASRDVEPRG